jgi:16S rRNA (guanine966-N2)-methyltransferase
MRICGGKARGIPLRVSKKAGVRPAIETIRERLFSSISSYVDHARTLDLFAGSGAYGLEALSRGAEHATFVEKSRSVFVDLNTNLKAVLKSAHLPADSGKLVKRDVLDFLREKPSLSYDLIVVDPPYPELGSFCPKIFSLLLANNYLSAKGIVILECPGDFTIDSSGWTHQRMVGKEKKGSPIHRIFERSN